jgi:hypothetical protein
MQTAEASDFTMGTCGRIRPPSLLTAYITSGTPCPRASGAKLVIRKVTIRPPTTGTTMMNAPHGLGGVKTLAS